MSGAVDEPCRPILCSSRPWLTPGNPRSTMKAVNASPSTLAKTMKTSAKPQLVIHIFSPVSAKLPSASRIARRARAQRVRARARLAERIGADLLAAHEPGRYALSAPRCRSRAAARSRDRSARRTWCRTRPSARCPRRRAASSPCRDRGRRRPRARRSPSARARRSVRSGCRARSQSFASSSSRRGNTSPSAKSRAVFAISRCSSVSCSGVNTSAARLLDQPAAALPGLGQNRHRTPPSILTSVSNTPAAPMPPPTHIVTMP